MIFAILDNEETQLVENWNKVGKVKGLILTDGLNIIEKLVGYSFYSIEKEGISSLTYNSGVKHTPVVRETIYGINDISVAEEELLEAFNNKLKSISESKKDSKTITDNLALCREKYDRALKKLKGKQVVYKSLVIETGYGDRDNILDKNIRKGNEEKRSASDYLGKNYIRLL